MLACSGQNYNFRCINVFFLACFCASQRVQRLRAELTLAQIREKLPNGCTDWHQIGQTCAYSSWNGYPPNRLPLKVQEGTWGGGGWGPQIKSLRKMSNGWADWHQLWFTSADSSWNGHRLNTIGPSIPHGAFRGVLRSHRFKSLAKAIKRLDRLASNLAHVCGFVWEWT